MSRPPNQGIATAEAVSDGGMALFDPARVWNRFLPMSSLDKPAAVSILSRGVVDWDVGLELPALGSGAVPARPEAGRPVGGVHEGFPQRGAERELLPMATG